MRKQIATVLVVVTALSFSASTLAFFVLLTDDYDTRWSILGWMLGFTVAAGMLFAAVSGSLPEMQRPDPVEVPELPDDAGEMGRIWAKEFRRDPTIPPYGAAPYWEHFPDRPPLMLTGATMGREERLRNARDVHSSAILRGLMASDPDPVVRAAALETNRRVRETRDADDEWFNY